MLHRKVQVPLTGLTGVGTWVDWVEELQDYSNVIGLNKLHGDPPILCAPHLNPVRKARGQRSLAAMEVIGAEVMLWLR